MDMIEEKRTGPEAGDRAIARSTSFLVPRDADGGSLQRVDRRETSDAYRSEMFRFGRFRVAVCRDGLQWLYQRRRPGFAGVGTAWDTLGYCATRTALIRLHRSHTGTDGPELYALPEHIMRRNAE